MQKDKIESLIGFAINAGSVIYGIDSVEEMKKHKHLVIYCASASDNTIKRVKNFSEKFKVPSMISKKLLDDITHKTNCKVIGITSKQMAKAMMSFTNNDFHLNPLEVK